MTETLSIAVIRPEGESGFKEFLDQNPNAQYIRQRPERFYRSTIDNQTAIGAVHNGRFIGVACRFDYVDSDSTLPSTLDLHVEYGAQIVDPEFSGFGLQKILCATSLMLGLFTITDATHFAVVDSQNPFFERSAKSLTAAGFTPTPIGDEFAH